MSCAGEFFPEIYKVEATYFDARNLGKINCYIAPDTDEVNRRYFEINSDMGIVTSKNVFQDMSAAQHPDTETNRAVLRRGICP